MRYFWKISRAVTLTTRALNIGHQHGYRVFLRQAVASCISVACKMLTTLGLTIDDAVSDGSQANAGQRLIRAQGNAAALHQDGRQSRMCWSGVAVFDYLCSNAGVTFVNVTLMAISPAPESNSGHPLTGLAGNHAGSTVLMRKTILLFANHRHFLQRQSGPGQASSISYVATHPRRK